MILPIIITILWMAIIYFRAFIDSRLIKAKLTIDHQGNAFITIIGAAIFSCIANQGFWFDMWAYFFILLFIHWVFFDGFLNRRIGREWLRLGTTAFLDRIFKDKYTQLVAKLIGLGVSVGMFIWLKF